MMRRNVYSLFEKVGLERKQAQIYLALIELGKGTVQDISKKTNIKRTSIYPILEAMQKRGLLFHETQHTKKYYVPEDPKQLSERLSRNVNKLTDELEKFSLQHAEHHESTVQFFDGAEGFKKIWREIFSSGTREYLIITDPQEFLGFVRKQYIEKAIIQRKREEGIRSRQIIAFSEYSKEVIAKDTNENRESRILPHSYKIPYTTIIFDNKVALISPMPENIIMIIESEAFAKTQRSFFEALWESLKTKKSP